MSRPFFRQTPASWINIGAVCRRLILLIAIVCGAPTGHDTLFAVDLDIALKHGSAKEEATADQLRRLLSRFDVTPWIMTSRVEIDEGGVPHSHPVLTLHTRHLAHDDLLLSTLIHEQLHWWLVRHSSDTAAAVTDLRASFPNVVLGTPDGAETERSFYEHLLVNYLEWQGDKVLLGESKALEIMTYWSADHYRQVYKIVLASESRIRDIVTTHGLNCCQASR